jgi:hypothetical protein
VQCVSPPHPPAPVETRDAVMPHHVCRRAEAGRLVGQRDTVGQTQLGSARSVSSMTKELDAWRPTRRRYADERRYRSAHGFSLD